MSATLLLVKNVYLSLELCVSLDGAGGSQDLTSQDILSLDATKKDTNVVSCLAIGHALLEHLYACI